MARKGNPISVICDLNLHIQVGLMRDYLAYSRSALLILFVSYFN